MYMLEALFKHGVFRDECGVNLRDGGEGQLDLAPVLRVTRDWVAIEVDRPEVHGVAEVVQVPPLLQLVVVEL